LRLLLQTVVSDRACRVEPFLDVRALLSTSPAQLGLWIPELRLELVFDALAAALKKAREMLRANRDFTELPRSLAHHTVVLPGLVPANVERLLQCCDVII
jgi:hypothetical protein